MRKIVTALLALLLSTAAIADGINIPPVSYTTPAWTPTITASGTVGTPAYTTQIGSVEKIGRQVTARFTLVLSGWTGSPTGNPLIVLPYTSTATTDDRGGCFFHTYTVAGLPALTYGLVGLILPNTSTAFIISNGNATTGAINIAQTGTTPIFQGVCFYRTD